MGEVVGNTPPSPAMSEDAEQRKQLRKDNKRLLKWQVMIEDWEFFTTHHPRKIQQRIQQGIPDCLRGTVWQMMADSLTLRHENRGAYQELLRRPPTQIDGYIGRDIGRTFPKHICFRERRGLGQQSLFNVLKAYSEHHPVVGYCQGMGFVCALLLIYMDEESTFWMMHRLVGDYEMEGLYKDGLPDLAMHFYVLERLLSIYCPKLLDHLKEESVSPSMYASQWFLTLFSLNFPFNTVLRIWDIYFAEGMLIVYRVAVAVMLRIEGDLLQLSLERILERIATATRNEANDDAMIADALAVDLTPQRLKEIVKLYTDSPAVRAAAQPIERGDFAFTKPSWLAK